MSAPVDVLAVSTHRLIQLHDLADKLSAYSRVLLRGAGNLERVGNHRGAHYQRAKGLRVQAISDRAARRIGASA